MSKLTKDNARNQRRRNRSKISQNNLSDRLRLVVSRSLKNIQAQIVDDINGKTLVSVTSLDKSLKSDMTKAKGKIERSKMPEKVELISILLILTFLPSGALLILIHFLFFRFFGKLYYYNHKIF